MTTHSRARLLDRLVTERFDVLVVGGGINGAVSAAALTAAGASVALVDRGDFAGLTSQESSNLVWGGIKYLQGRELRLVWSLCAARNRLVAAYPAQVRPTRFLGVIDADAPFGRRVVGAGAALYWALGRGAMAPPRTYGRRRAAAIEPLIDVPGLRGAVEYSDARLVDGDARFVWGFVAAALGRGAAAVNYVELVAAERGRVGWRVRLREVRTGEEWETSAGVVVNAAGPLALDVGQLLASRTGRRLALSKGVHLVVPRLVAEDRVIAMFDDDDRPFYVIPLHDRSLIGTTDTRVDGPGVEVSAEDRAFLLDQVNRRLALGAPLTPDDVVAERAGVRPLVLPPGDEDVRRGAGHGGDAGWLTLSRRHHIEADPRRKVVTILGGKLTDCLNVGEEVLAEVARAGVDLHPAGTWYGADPVPAPAELHRLTRDARGLAPDEDRVLLAEAVWRRHGRRAHEVFRAWRDDPAQAEEVYAGTGLTRGELALMVRDELVVTLEDLLRRRTLLGLTRRAADLRAEPMTAELAQAIDPGAGDPAVADLLR